MESAQIFIKSKKPHGFLSNSSIARIILTLDTFHMMSLSMRKGPCTSTLLLSNFDRLPSVMCIFDAETTIAQLVLLDYGDENWPNCLELLIGSRWEEFILMNVM